MFVGDVGRRGETSSHVKNLTAQTWRSTRGWCFSSKCGFDRLALLVHRGAVYRSTGVCHHNLRIVGLLQYQHKCITEVRKTSNWKRRMSTNIKSCSKNASFQPISELGWVCHGVQIFRQCVLCERSGATCRPAEPTGSTMFVGYAGDVP